MTSNRGSSPRFQKIRSAVWRSPPRNGLAADHDQYDWEQGEACEELERIEDTIRHVLRYGRVGKQSRQRLKELIS